MTGSMGCAFTLNGNSFKCRLNCFSLIFTAKCLALYETVGTPWKSCFSVHGDKVVVTFFLYKLQNSYGARLKYNEILFFRHM
jgi:hypothetical protein